MKSLLIIDTPKSCGDCPCVGEEFSICQADVKNRDCDWYKIPSWCPLKPLPTDMIGAYANSLAEDYISFTEGWDSYEKALMGETE